MPSKNSGMSFGLLETYLGEKTKIRSATFSYVGVLGEVNHGAYEGNINANVWDDVCVGKHSSKQKKSPYDQIRTLWRWGLDRIVPTLSFSRRRVRVDRAQSPSNVDDGPANCPRTIPRTEDRNNGLSTWFQVYDLHDPAALRLLELIVAEELEGGD